MTSIISHEQLKDQLRELHNLARVQRCLRLGIRAFWLGVSGIILSYGIHNLWGLLPNRLSWIAIGLVMAAIPLAGILIALKSRSSWVWLLDQRLGLHEQVSTAWEVIEKGQSSGLSDLLIRDVSLILRRVRNRMLRRGWFIEIDLISALIVILLSALLLGSGLIQPFTSLIGQGPAAFEAPLPPLQSLQQPAIDEQQQPPEDAPGGGDQPGGEMGSGGQPDPGQPGSDPSNQQPGQGESTIPDAGEVGEILRELGRELSRQAGTYDLGQALENMDLSGAADALDQLKDQIDELSPESLDNLGQALDGAAPSLERAGQPELSREMAQSADSLQQGDSSASEEMGQMADQLRALADQMGPAGQAGAGSGGSGGGGTGNPEPLSRLPGEGGDMDLPLEDPSQSSLLTPSHSGQPGNETASGSQDSTISPGDMSTQSPLYPSSFLWKWRNVVSQYFQR